MRRPIQRGLSGAFLIVLGFAAVACPSKGSLGVFPAPHVQPDPETGNEEPGRNPHPDSLGGPYAFGRAGVDHNTATPVAPPGLSTGTISDADLSRYLNSLNFDKARDNGELALIACKPPAVFPCGVRIYIQPEVGMKHQRHADVPRNGIVVARIINYSPTDSDVTYGIPRLTRAYWFVDRRAPGSPPRSRVFIRTFGGARALQFIGPDTTYSQCEYHAPAGGPAVAKFRRCVPYQVSRMPGDVVVGGWSNPFVRTVSLSPAVPKPDFALTETELWVKCAQGCCVAGTAQ